MTAQKDNGFIRSMTAAEGCAVFVHVDLRPLLDGRRFSGRLLRVLGGHAGRLKQEEFVGKGTMDGAVQFLWKKRLALYL